MTRVYSGSWLAAGIALWVAWAPPAIAQEGTETQSKPAPARRDPFRNPMLPKEGPNREEPAPKSPGEARSVPLPEEKRDPVRIAPDPAPDARASALREFAGLRIQVLGVICRVASEPVTIHSGVEVFGAVAQGEVTVNVSRVEATALVQHEGIPRLVSSGESLGPNLIVRVIRPHSVVFQFRGVDIEQPLGTSGS